MPAYLDRPEWVPRILSLLESRAHHSSCSPNLQKINPLYEIQYLHSWKPTRTRFLIQQIHGLQDSVRVYYK